MSTKRRSKNRKGKGINQLWKSIGRSLPVIEFPRFRKSSHRRSRPRQSPLEGGLAALEVPLEARTPSYLILNLIGYFLVLVSTIDYLNILYPLQLTNPDWEFSVMGQLVEHVLVLLIGLGLIFFRPRGSVLRLELRFLAVLRWVVLGLGIIYFLMVPLAIRNSFALLASNKAQYTTQLDRQEVLVERSIQQLDSEGDRLKKAQGQLPADQWDQVSENYERSLKSLRGRLGLAQEADGSTSDDIFQQLDQISTRLTQVGTQTQQQLDSAFKERTVQIWERSIKLNLGSLMAGLLFVTLWRSTAWIKLTLQRSRLAKPKSRGTTTALQDTSFSDLLDPTDSDVPDPVANTLNRQSFDEEDKEPTFSNPFSEGKIPQFGYLGGEQESPIPLRDLDPGLIPMTELNGEPPKSGPLTEEDTDIRR